MQFGVILTTGSPRDSADLAAAAEAAGWDAVFTWDGIAIGVAATYDPWIVMAAMAMATEHIRLGAILTPPSRRRPWKLAREAMSLDRLSQGRLILPVGLGALDDRAFGNVGEATDARTRAALLDESLAILEGLWSGEPFAFDGQHYRFDPMTFRPTPVQQPRIPIWVAATTAAERSVARAFRFDGILPQTRDPEAIRAIAARAARDRPTGATGEPFAIVVEGSTATDAQASPDEVAGLARAGATWWVESDWGAASIESLRARIQAGPPRIA